MSRAIHCLGRRAMVLLKPYPALTPATSNSILEMRTNHVATSRNIFNATAIGIEKLDALRTNKAQVFTGQTRDRYLERMRGYYESGDCKSIYRDDLVNMIAIADSDQDLDLIEKILENSDAEQKSFFGGWGTTIMRLYYKLDQVDRAVKNIQDTERFGQFFNTRSCYKIVMSMLYDRGQYQKILDLYQQSTDLLKDTSAYVEYKDRTGNELSPDRDLTVLALAALAKLNTPEALQEAKTLFTKNIVSGGRNIGLRPASLVAYLAISNGDPLYALNLISTIPSRNYVSLRDTKILALLQLARYDDALLHLRDLASNYKLSNNRMTKSTFEELHKCKENMQDVATRQELDDLLREIKEGNHVSEETLEMVVFKPIEHERQRIKPGDEQNQNRRGHFREDGGRNRQPFRRSRYDDDTEDHYEDDRYDQRSRRNERGGSGGGPRNDRRFSFQNVNFEA